MPEIAQDIKSPHVQFPQQEDPRSLTDILREAPSHAINFTASAAQTSISSYVIYRCAKKEDPSWRHGVFFVGGLIGVHLGIKHLAAMSTDRQEYRKELRLAMSEQISGKLDLLKRAASVKMGVHDNN
jgi:hypothetical protein